MLIEVIGLRHVARGRLRAFADVLVGDLILRDFVILDGPDRRAFVGVPRKAWVNNGQRYFTPIVDFRNGLRNKVEEAILLRWSAELDQKLRAPSKERAYETEPRHPTGWIGTPA